VGRDRRLRSVDRDDVLMRGGFDFLSEEQKCRRALRRFPGWMVKCGHYVGPKVGIRNRSNYVACMLLRNTCGQVFFFELGLRRSGYGFKVEPVVTMHTHNRWMLNSAGESRALNWLVLNHYYECENAVPIEVRGKEFWDDPIVDRGWKRGIWHGWTEVARLKGDVRGYRREPGRLERGDLAHRGAGECGWSSIGDFGAPVVGAELLLAGNEGVRSDRDREGAGLAGFRGEEGEQGHLEIE
jgi:hypothetical protein